MLRESDHVEPLPSPTGSADETPTPSTAGISVGQQLMAQPLVPLATGLIVGIALDFARPLPLWEAAAILLLAGAVLYHARHQVLRHLALAAAALAVGAVLHDHSFRRWPENHLVRYTGHEPVYVRLQARVLTEPSLRDDSSDSTSWFPQVPRTRFLAQAEELEGIDRPLDVSGVVSVTVREPALHVSVGDRVELFGRMHPPPPPANPGAKDWALWLRRQRILVQVACEHAANVTVLEPAPAHAGWLAGARRRARLALLDHTFPGEEPGSRLLSAMVLGQRSAVDPRLNELFANAGVVHYLSVSGAHVGMLAGAVWLVGAAGGASRRRCAVGTFLLVTVYAVLAEPRTPILRAALMVDLLCVAIALRRPVRTANWLAMAAIVILLVRPTQLFDAGFQLSFVTVLGILYLAPRLRESGKHVIDKFLRRDDPLLQPEIQRRLHPPTPLRRALDGAASILGWTLAIVFSAWLVSVLLAGYHFGRIAPWGWLNNLLVLPLIWVTQLLGLFKAALSAVLPAGARLLGPLLAACTRGLIGLVEALARLPGSGTPIPQLPGWLVASGLGVLAIWCFAPRLRLAHRVLGLAAGAWIVLAAWTLAPPAPGDVLRMHVLSVGSGTASVIQLPDGKTLLYDIGTMPAYDLERWTVGPLLARERIHRIDAVALSHPNYDHYCGLRGLLDRRPVRQVLTTPHFELMSGASSMAGRLVSDVKARGIPWTMVVGGNTLSRTGDVQVDVLWPPPPAAMRLEETNETSLVLRITHAGFRILVCGDIQAIAQTELIAREDLRADVLILPHHGGVDATTGAFIDAVDPTYCIRSSGHRDADTRNGLLELVAGRIYFNTADDGAIEITISPRGLTVTPFRSRPAR